MLEQVLAGTPVTLGLAGWTAYGPALALGLLALVLLAAPTLRGRPVTARRPDQVVVRATDDVGIRAYLPGLVLGIIAAALAYYGARPQVVIAADSLTCRPWTRPLAWSEITGFFEILAPNDQESSQARKLDLVQLSIHPIRIREHQPHASRIAQHRRREPFEDTAEVGVLQRPQPLVVEQLQRPPD